MNGLDLLLAVLAVVAVVGGWRLGFVTRSLGWLGAALGLTLAVLVVPGLLARLDLSDDTAVLLLGLACFVVAVALGQGIGAAVGARLRPEAEGSGARRADAAAGAALGLVGVAVLAWLVLPVMAQTKGWAASAARNSAVTRFVVDHLPAPPAQIGRLERELAGGTFPQLFSELLPAPDLPAPPTGGTVDGAVLARAQGSTVRVEGDACGYITSGSGFLAAPGLVATNAHVVAGNRDLELTTPDGARAAGTVVAFDPRTDLALVRTGLDRPALPLAEPRRGDRGLVLGYPGGGPLAPSPFEVGDLLDATGLDIYDQGEVRRDLVVLASDLAPGDSGSAVLRDDGRVVGVAVAIAPDRPGVAYALDPAQLTPLVRAAGDAPVGVGACLR